MRYKCEFPKCKYSTDDRNKIDYHHIIPKELQGNNKKYNRIWLCPNCHRKIYIPESKKGHHSKKTKESIILLNIYTSTGGRVLEYINEFGQILLDNI